MTLHRFDFLEAETFANQGAPAEFAATWARIEIGAEHLSGNVIVLPPGTTSAPYHWEASQEEWLLVLDGAPTVRAPEEEQTLRPGDVVCFPVGPTGAHQIRNDGEAPARIVLFSDVRRPEVIVYPDTGNVMITDPGLDTLLPLNVSTDYWGGA